MISKSLVALVGLIFSLSMIAQEQTLSGDYIKLADSLDEPEFYCFDLAGWGESLQLNDPLQAHTCKGGNAADQMFQFEGNRLKVSEYDRCIQIAGSGGATLAGSAVLVRPCAEDSPFQGITLDDDGKLRLTGSNLCLAAGDESTPANGPSHLWRTLTVENCNGLDASLSSWQVGM